MKKILLRNLNYLRKKERKKEKREVLSKKFPENYQLFQKEILQI
jgi:hypothetical protein